MKKGFHYFRHTTYYQILQIKTSHTAVYRFVNMLSPFNTVTYIIPHIICKSHIHRKFSECQRIHVHMLLITHRYTSNIGFSKTFNRKKTARRNNIISSIYVPVLQ